MEEDLIIETWDLFREYISEKNRNTAANQYIDYLLSKDVEMSTLEGFMGYDPHLDQAIELVLGNEKTESDNIDDEDLEWGIDEVYGDDED